MTAILLGLSALGAPSMAAASTIVRNLGHQAIKGQWAVLADDTYVIRPDVGELDINGDSQPELRFEHGYRRPSLYVSQDVASQVLFGISTLSEIDTTLERMRALALKSANADVNDDDSFVTIQTKLSALLDYIDRLSELTLNGQSLLSGQAGRMGHVSDPNVATVLQVSAEAPVGVVPVDVVTPGRRAMVTAAIPQEENLIQDEIISVNGVNIQFYMGMDQSAVIDRINEYQQLTWATALDFDGKTALVSTAWGVNGGISVVSNMSPAVNTTGFSNSVASAMGVDAVVQIDGASFTGNGDTVKFNRGPAHGTTLRVEPDDAAPWETVMGSVTVSIEDRSPTYLLRPVDQHQTLTVSYPNSHTSALGLLIANNQFAALDRIDVTSSYSAVASLQVIDQAANEIRSAIEQLEAIRDIYYDAQGQAFVSSADSSAAIALHLLPLAEGAMIDGNLTYGQGPLELTNESLVGAGQFLGFRWVDGLNTHYGWLRVDLGPDRSIILRQLAYESEPGRGIRVGYVPEPQAFLATLVGSVGLLAVYRRRRK